MKAAGDFFVKLFLNLVGLVLAVLTLFYGVYSHFHWVSVLATVSVVSGILLIALSVRQIRSILNVLSQKTETAGSYSLNPELNFIEKENPTQVNDLITLKVESEDANKAVSFDFPKSESSDRANLSSKDKINANYEFLEVIKKSKADHAFGQLEFIDEIYKKMKPYLFGERGLIISGSAQARGAYAPTLKQVLNGEKAIEQLICKNIYPDLDLLPDTELNLSADRRSLESLLMGLWSDYYRVVILAEEWDEEFWRMIARRVNARLAIDKGKEWLNLPAIKRKRPITYQSLSRFESVKNKNN